jgi:hypothetical protein
MLPSSASCRRHAFGVTRVLRTLGYAPRTGALIGADGLGAGRIRGLGALRRAASTGDGNA